MSIRRNHFWISQLSPVSMNITPAIVERARRLHLMLFDVDGILTDGRLYFGHAGEIMKVFHVRDGHGLKMLAESGVEIGLLTTRSSPMVEARAAELGIALVRQGEGDKRAAFERLLAQRGHSPLEAGYMGDDVMDLPVLIRCGFAATVPDAPEAVRDRVQYVCSAGGGQGAVREVCEVLLAARGKLESALGPYLS
jgi:3-deoxy-D-manno-octulosonate 8-phosphate phosphatase (KDO 8-P phosphatase)